MAARLAAQIEATAMLAPFRIALQACRNSFIPRKRDWLPDEAVATWYERMKATGLFIVENFADRNLCAQIRADILEVQRKYPLAVHHASNGADLRVFGADKGASSIAEFGSHPVLLKMAIAHLGLNTANAFTLAGTIEARQGNQGSGEGWHRDSFVGQFKALLYLTDVDVNNGPFEFILNSHGLYSKYRDKLRHGIPLNTTRICDDLVQHIIAREPERHHVVTGQAGTLVLADTTGIHRGRPLRNGRRAALTNYYFSSDKLGPELVDHFQPVLGRHVPI